MNAIKSADLCDLEFSKLEEFCETSDDITNHEYSNNYRARILRKFIEYYDGNEIEVYFKLINMFDCKFNEREEYIIAEFIWENTYE